MNAKGDRSSSPIPSLIEKVKFFKIPSDEEME